MASLIMFSPFCSVFRPSFPIKGLGNLIDSMIRGERDMERYDYWNSLYNDNYKFKQVGDRMTVQIEFNRAQINKIKEESNRLKK